jgi:hypothetical protein
VTAIEVNLGARLGVKRESVTDDLAVDCGHKEQGPRRLSQVIEELFPIPRIAGE